MLVFMELQKYDLKINYFKPNKSYFLFIRPKNCVLFFIQKRHIACLIKINKVPMNTVIRLLNSETVVYDEYRTALSIYRR